MDLESIEQASAAMICAMYQRYLRKSKPCARCTYVGGGWAHVKYSAMALNHKKMATKTIRQILREIAK